MKQVVAVAYNTSWYVWNFRMPLIAALRDTGFDVVVVAPRDDYTHRIEAAGIPCVDIALDAKGRNPLRDFRTIFDFRAVYKRLCPSVVLHYTVKPNLYGSIAARMLGIPVVNNVTGLGQAFEGRGLLRALVCGLYRFAFSRAGRVFFQNPDDMRLFLDKRLVRPGAADLLPGSGVDLRAFAPRERGAGPFTFLFVGRLLKAKGVEDLVVAARAVRRMRPDVVVRLLGKRTDDDPAAAAPALLDAAVAEGVVELAGATDDVRPYLAAAACVVLPSYYREGTPRSLLEAAAMAKPLIAADSVGTREPVEDGVNGYLCRPRDPEDLAGKMLAIAALPHARLAAMEAASRRIAETRFDERIVIGKYLDVVRHLTGSGEAS